MKQPPTSPRPTCPPPNAAAIPSVLRDRRQWVCWRYAWREDRWTKMPVTVEGKPASTADPSTWSTFDVAIAEYPRVGCDGVGFVFSKDDPFTGVDLDDCLNVAGEPTPDAAALIASLDSYTETSPSGTGVKVFVVAAKPAHAECRKKNVEGCDEIEIYDHKRYFTVTGARWPGTSAGVEDRQEQLTALCNKHWPPAGDIPRRKPDLAVDTEGDDDALLQKMFGSKNGAAIKKLFDGDTSKFDGDESRADLALCSHVAYWAGKDPARIDRLFRRSKLYREKWERDGYCERTIRKAISSLVTPQGASAPTPTAVSILKGPAPFLPCTDLGNAERMAMYCAERIRYCHTIGRWFRWDGQRWRRDDAGTAYQCAAEVARSIYVEASRCDNADTRSALSKWAMQSESRQRLDAMVALARSQAPLVIMTEAMNRDPLLLNVRNGTIDLRNGVLLPHRRENLITMLAPVDYDDRAECPLFLQFLNRAFADDAGLIRFVQTWMGLCLSGLIDEQILPIFHGMGANGKSVLLDTCMAIMGDYACIAPPTLLVESGNQHPTELADLCGRRLVVASETEQGAVLKLQLVKQLTGDKKLKGRFMRQDFFEFDRTHKTIMVTNNRPVVREESEAVWRRLRLVPFHVVIPPAERDPKLLEKLRDEWPGILAWMVQGCLVYQLGGMETPQTVAAATNDYRASEDVLGKFIDDRMVTAAPGTADFESLHVPWSTLMVAYRGWITETGAAEMRESDLRTALDQRGYRSDQRRVGGKSVKVRVGLGLKTPPHEGEER